MREPKPDGMYLSALHTVFGLNLSQLKKQGYEGRGFVEFGTSVFEEEMK